MTSGLKAMFRAIWNGPFYVGPLAPPVSVGEAILKDLETAWRAVLSVVLVAVLLVSAIYAWVQWVGPLLFPPLHSQVRAAAVFDDGAGPMPPLDGVTSDGSGFGDRIFRCSPDHPIKVVFRNESKDSMIGHLNFSIEGKLPNRSTNLVEGASWREVDAIIPSGYTFQSCWSIAAADGYAAKDLTYEIEVWGATEADPDTRFDPSPAKTADPKPVEATTPLPSPSPNPQLALGNIADGDWEKIGMGCSCWFSSGAPPMERLIAGGDGITFFRLNGKDRNCSAPDTQAMFEGPVSIACGATAIQVTPFGEVEPGFDGHSSKARLSIADNSGTLNLTGTWGCGC